MPQPDYCKKCGRDKTKRIGKTEAPCSHGGYCEWIRFIALPEGRRITIDAALIETLLEIPGVTEAVLRKAIYRFRTKLGLCTKGNGSCNEPALPGKPLCERHNELQEAANARFQRKQTKT